MHTLILATLAAVATAMPSYIAVPADQIAFLDLSALRVRRVPRQTLTPPPPPPQLPQALYEQEYQQEYHPVTLQQYQQQHSLSDPKQLRGGVIFLKEMPTTPQLKIDRRKIKELVINTVREA